MEKENIIISIIIVLCIAAAVAAYGITNSNNPIFSDLSSMSSGDTSGNGLGNNTTMHNGSGSSVATTDGGNSGSGSSGSSSSGSGSGSSSGSSSSGSHSGGSSSGRSSSTHLSYSQAQSIASSANQEPGCYIKYQGFSNGAWHFTVYNANGTNVDTISVDDASGTTGRG